LRLGIEHELEYMLRHQSALGTWAPPQPQDNDNARTRPLTSEAGVGNQQFIMAVAEEDIGSYLPEHSLTEDYPEVHVESTIKMLSVVLLKQLIW
jgi:hypothetical protein